MQQRALAPWLLPPIRPAYKSEVLPPPPRVGPWFCWPIVPPPAYNTRYTRHNNRTAKELAAYNGVLYAIGQQRIGPCSGGPGTPPGEAVGPLGKKLDHLRPEPCGGAVGPAGRLHGQPMSQATGHPLQTMLAAGPARRPAPGVGSPPMPCRHTRPGHRAPAANDACSGPRPTARPESAAPGR